MHSTILQEEKKIQKQLPCLSLLFFIVSLTIQLPFGPLHTLDWITSSSSSYIPHYATPVRRNQSINQSPTPSCFLSLNQHTHTHKQETKRGLTDSIQCFSFSFNISQSIKSFEIGTYNIPAKSPLLLESPPPKQHTHTQKPLNRAKKKLNLCESL